MGISMESVLFAVVVTVVVYCLAIYCFLVCYIKNMGATGVTSQVKISLVKRIIFPVLTMLAFFMFIYFLAFTNPFFGGLLFWLFFIMIPALLIVSILIARIFYKELLYNDNPNKFFITWCSIFLATIIVCPLVVRSVVETKRAIEQREIADIRADTQRKWDNSTSFADLTPLGLTEFRQFDVDDRTSFGAGDGISFTWHEKGTLVRRQDLLGNSRHSGIAFLKPMDNFVKELEGMNIISCVIFNLNDVYVIEYFMQYYSKSGTPKGLHGYFFSKCENGVNSFWYNYGNVSDERDEWIQEHYPIKPKSGIENMDVDNFSKMIGLDEGILPNKTKPFLTEQE